MKFIKSKLKIQYIKDDDAMKKAATFNNIFNFSSFRSNREIVNNKLVEYKYTYYLLLNKLSHKLYLLKIHSSIVYIIFKVSL